MKNFIAGEYRQQREYKSFTPSLVNRYFVWEDPEINILMARAMQLLGELNAYAELIPDVDFFIQMTITKEITGYSRNRFFVLEKYLNLFRS